MKGRRFLKHLTLAAKRMKERERQETISELRRDLAGLEELCSKLEKQSVEPKRLEKIKDRIKAIKQKL